MLGNNQDKDITIKSPSSFAKLVKKRWLIWGGLGVVVISYFSMSVASDRGSRVTRTVQPEFTDVTPGVKTSEEITLTRLQRELELTQQQMEKQAADDAAAFQRLLKELEKEREERREAMEKLKLKDKQHEEQIRSRSLARSTPSQSSQTPPPPQEPPRTSTDPESYIMPPRTGSSGSVAPPSRRRADDNQREALPSRSQAPSPTREDAYVLRADSASQSSATILKGPPAPQANESELDKLSGMLPMGSFMEVAVLTGADFGASSKSQSNPQPTLLRIQDNSFLPNHARFDLRNCFAMGAGYGDMSAERAYITGTRISCIHSETGQVLEAEVQSYLVDSDGRLGMRGVVERRSGAIMAKAMVAGFAEGAAKILSSASLESTSTVTGSGVVSTINTDELAKAGAFSGAGRAAEILAQQYLDEAESMFPVIAVNPGRKAHMVIQIGQKLKWKAVNGEEEE